MIVGISIVTAAGLAWAGGHLGLNNDEMALFEPDVPFLKLRDDFRSAFPNLIDPIVVVVDGGAPASVAESTRALAATLRAQPELFVAVYDPGASDFFERNGLMYLSSDELEISAQGQGYVVRVNRESWAPFFADLSILSGTAHARRQTGRRHPEPPPPTTTR